MATPFSLSSRIFFKPIDRKRVRQPWSSWAREVGHPRVTKNALPSVQDLRVARTQSGSCQTKRGVLELPPRDQRSTSPSSRRRYAIASPETPNCIANGWKTVPPYRPVVAKTRASGRPLDASCINSSAFAGLRAYALSQVSSNLSEQPKLARNRSRTMFGGIRNSAAKTSASFSMGERWGRSPAGPSIALSRCITAPWCNIAWPSS